MRSRSLAHRLPALIALIVAAITFLAFVALSPLALRALVDAFGLNWNLLSNAGQTYGAVSALVTALALGGVAISLLYQAKDVSAARSQAIRTFQFELLRMELADADLMQASGAPWGFAIRDDHEILRQYIFANMWLSFWEDQFLLREMSPMIVRLSLRELFTGKPAREYWKQVRGNRLFSSEGRTLRYLRIVDEEYRNALATSPAVPPGKAAPRGTLNRRAMALGVASACLAAASAGVLACHLLLHRWKDFATRRGDREARSRW